MPQFVFGYGIGTSRITLQKYNASVGSLGSLSISYTVSIASGSTWGTDLNVVNAASLSADKIHISITNNGGDPPFSGLLEISSNGAKPGKYSVLINATGDDPSVSSVVLSLLVTNSTGSASTSGNVLNATGLNPGGYASKGGYSIIYVVIGLLLLIIPIPVFAAVKKLGAANIIIKASLAIEIIAGAYLIFFDQYLRDLGSMHWYLLIVYTLLNLFFLLEYGKRKKLGALSIKQMMEIIPAIMAFMIIVDAAFNLPLSQAAGTSGWAYLFGFGTNQISAFMPSIGTSVLLFLSVLIALLSFYEKE